MHALIIEPQGLISVTIEDELRELGFSSFDSAFTQDSAIQAAERRRPDLITTSLRLVRGDGVSAVRAICAEEGVPTVLIVSDAVEAKNLIDGAPIVTKPMKRDSLRAAVYQAIHNPQT
ncbi:response regulator [Tsuneonella troitsensis]|uniref:response regulator n=1 Tax=Tsuneonella troitsensis TaxID=292222 RepID=UPI000709D7D7|nr:response regulator [Tsuneonella troitsensis]